MAIEVLGSSTKCLLLAEPLKTGAIGKIRRENSSEGPGDGDGQCHVGHASCRVLGRLS